VGIGGFRFCIPGDTGFEACVLYCGKPRDETFVCVKQVKWVQEIIKEPPVSDRAGGSNILKLILEPPPPQRQYLYFCTRKASNVGVAYLRCSSLTERESSG
jgi:hypothetical protein